MTFARAVASMKQRRADESGMTLVELTVSVLVLGIVLATAMSFISSALMHGTEISEETQLQNETRQVLDQMVRELRQATSGSVSTPVAAIQTPMQSDTITFLSPNSVVPAYGMRRIRYTAVAGELRRSVVTSTDTDGYPWVIGSQPADSKVLGSVQNTAVFTYLDDEGVVTTVPAAVHTVRITVDIDPFPSTGASAKTYTVSVHPRAAL
jgi:type II secretory pathway pseudopilin PulG